MKTGMTRLGGRSPSRTLAVPAVRYLRLAARGGQPVAPARARGPAPEIIELILADHERIRRLLRGDDDTARYREDPGCLGARPGGNAGAALAGVHACRAGAERCSRFRCTAARSASASCWPIGMLRVRWTAACSPTCWSSPMPGHEHCPDPAVSSEPLAARSAGRIPGPSSPGHVVDQRPARSGPARAGRSRCGPLPAAISAPRQMWPRLSEHGG